MENIDLNFSVLETTPYQVSGVPAGVYDVEIFDCFRRETKEGRGVITFFAVKIISGQFKNHELKIPLMLEHIRDDVVDINKSKLAAILIAIGMDHVGNAAEMFGKPFRLSVEPQPANPEYLNFKDFCPVPKKSATEKTASSITHEKPEGDDLIPW